MTINLNRFTNEVEVTVPIIKGFFQYKRRKVQLEDIPEDGWYKVALGNTATVLSKSTKLQVDLTLSEKKNILFYAFGEEGIPVNFDNLKQRGFNESVKIEFLDLPIFEIAKAVQWDDGRFYFYEEDPRFQREMLRSLKQDFNLEKDAQIDTRKGVTPELAYYYLLLNFQRQTYRELERLSKMRLAKEEREKRLAQYRSTFEGRLKEAVGSAGGTLIRYSKANANSYMVEWKTMGQIVKTVIQDNLQVLSAGFCLSGADRKHSMASLVQLARMFQKDEGRHLYITRE